MIRLLEVCAGLDASAVATAAYISVFRFKGVAALMWEVEIEVAAGRIFLLKSMSDIAGLQQPRSASCDNSLS
jgi:hypothetical protein